jgi:short-subunit dehydrogenase
MFDDLAERAINVDYLVNNAGFGIYGEFSRGSVEEDLEMMQLNMIALVHLTKLFLPQMLTRKSGRIMNVASTAAFQPGPLMAIYYATKAFVLSFSEAIANELKASGVSVTCLCPGATKTEFAKRANMESSRLFKLGAAEAGAVARAGYEGMMQGKTLVIPGVRNKLMAQSVRLAPRKMVTAIARTVQEHTKG